MSPQTFQIFAPPPPSPVEKNNCIDCRFCSPPPPPHTHTAAAAANILFEWGRGNFGWVWLVLEWRKLCKIYHLDGHQTCRTIYYQLRIVLMNPASANNQILKLRIFIQ